VKRSTQETVKNMSDELARYLQETKSQVEAQLDRLLQTGERCPATLAEAMRYSALAPGKRLRPILVLMAAEAAGGKTSEALPAACAVEMVHVYSLIHDDLPAMDNDDLRRGLPTCHKKFGDALAILAGDGLLTLAFQVLAERYPAAPAAACCRELARGAGVCGMVGGQVEDLAWEENGSSERARTPEALENIHAHKTGALFRACLRIGVHVAQGERAGGADADLLERLDGFGRAFGLVFQITDDLLDVESTTAQTGKRVQKDAARGKLTYPSFWGVDESRRRARLLCEQASERLRPLGAAARKLDDLVWFILQRSG
jgi:geranylgeranyl diphosphate synthase type II